MRYRGRSNGGRLVDRVDGQTEGGRPSALLLHHPYYYSFSALAAVRGSHALVTEIAAMGGMVVAIFTTTRGIIQGCALSGSLYALATIPITRPIDMIRVRPSINELG